MAQTTEQSLSERVVKEAVERGLETPMREPILEAVEESEVATPTGRRRWPLAGILVGVGAAIGYAAAQSADIETAVSSEIPEPVEETVEESSVEVEEPSENSGSGILRKVLIAAGIVGVAVLIKRRMGGSDEPEWEPIEEFEPDTDAESDFAGPAGTTDIEEEDDVEGETAELDDEE